MLANYDLVFISKKSPRPKDEGLIYSR